MTSIADHFRQTYGIGRHLARSICLSIGVSPAKAAATVSGRKRHEGFGHLGAHQPVGFRLQEREKAQLVYETQVANVRSLKRRAHLPVNGQRNKTNGKTARRLAPRLMAILRSEGEVKSSSNGRG